MADVKALLLERFIKSTGGSWDQEYELLEVTSEPCSRNVPASMSKGAGSRHQHVDNLSARAFFF